MQLHLAADHAGYALKEKLKAHYAKSLELVDLTPTYRADDDYPIVATKLSSHVARPTSYVGKTSRTNAGRLGRGTSDDRLGRGMMGVLVCGSGVGVCIAANRHKGIRAAVGHTSAEIKLAREHNDINVLCLSGRSTNIKEAIKMIDVFLKTKKSKAARHARRVKLLG